MFYEGRFYMKNNNSEQLKNSAPAHSDIKVEVGKKLLNLRKESGLKQADVADAVGITRASLSYYEKGERSIDIDVLYKLSEFFNVSIDYLFGLSDKVPPQREHSANREIINLGFSHETIDRLWGNHELVSMINDFISHADFAEFEKLTYHTRYTAYENMDRNYRSFLTSRLLYSMIADIFEKWYKDDNDKIKTLSEDEQKELLSDIEKYLDKRKKRNDLLENGMVTSEYIKYDSSIHDDLMMIYEKLKYLLTKDMHISK